MIDKSVFSDAAAAVAMGLGEWVAAHERGQGLRPVALDYLKHADHRVAAEIAMRVLAKEATGPNNSATRVAVEIGRRIEAHQLPAAAWSQEVCFRVGLTLIETAVRVTRLVALKEDAGKRLIIVSASTATAAA